MKKRYYFIIGILAYLFFTLGNIPAARVISLVQQQAPNSANIYGVYGSLWQGGADKLLLRNTPEINSLQWDINPAYLLLAQLNGEIRASIKNQNLIGQVKLGPTGSLSASDVRARIDAPVMQELMQLPFGELAGTFVVNIVSLDHLDNPVPSIEAQIKWQNARLTFTETVNLGHVTLDIKPDDKDQLVATISNQQGQLSLEGEIFIDQQKAYAMHVRIRPEQTASANITQSLKMFARRQTDGSYLVNRKGNLNEFGM